MSQCDNIDLLRDYLTDRDVNCTSCGYNLRGSECAKCPECGHVFRGSGWVASVAAHSKASSIVGARSTPS